MKLLIVSTAPFIYKDTSVYAYGPYVNELVLWQKYVVDIAFCCPIWQKENGLLTEKIPFKIHTHFKLIDFNLNSLQSVLKASFCSLYNVVLLFKGMLWADHIHLRCPGNIGLLGCMIQIFFPNTPKTAKYAGNWDPQSKQPRSYRLQKWILKNSFLTRNIQVLVYGDWEGSSKNIKPFFTATYCEADKIPLKVKNLNGRIHFVFAGTLVSGKNPLYAIQLIDHLTKKGYDVHLNLFGEGRQRTLLEQYIQRHALEKTITLNGNQTPERVKEAYQNSHFVVLPSQSEGWPKAIAEGMFWGCVPLAKSVSCVPFMLDYGKRGILLELNLQKDVAKLVAVLLSQLDYDNMRKKAADWSRNYTLDFFEQEIKGLLRQKKQIEQ